MATSVILLSDILGQTNEDSAKILDGRLHSFVQNIHDTVHTIGSPQTITANTPVLFTNNGGVTIKEVAPDYITSRWNTTTNSIAFPEELNTPTYVAEIGFTFDPTVSAAGVATLRIKERVSGNVLKTYTADYKAVAETLQVLGTWFLGDDVGYDAKNNGVVFELEFDTAGNLYDKTTNIYRT